jgi:phosphatidylglycerophosphatase A
MMRAVATLFGVGLLRPAPGTWGSAVAVILGLGIDRLAGFPGLLLATGAVLLAGLAACKAVCGPGEDPSEVVIDEVAGMWIALLFPSLAFWWMGHAGWMPYPGWVAAFLLFRLFDIWKPWLVGRADARGDAMGVMLDDVWAGLFAGIGVIVAAGLAHGLLMG